MVQAGWYEDDHDDGEEIIYTGELMHALMHGLMRQLMYHFIIIAYSHTSSHA